MSHGPGPGGSEIGDSFMDRFGILLFWTSALAIAASLWVGWVDHSALHSSLHALETMAAKERAENRQLIRELTARIDRLEQKK